ncbi:MAG: hypothetical protein WBG48_13820 [Pricia sp.]
MIDSISFLNPHLIWPVAFGGILLWMVFIWKEWTPVRHARVYLKILIALLALSSLALLVLRPMVMRHVDTYPAILLTKGYDSERLDSLKQVHKDVKVLEYEINKPMGMILDSIGSLSILGEGIKPFDFWQLEDVPTQYIGKVEPHGITAVNYESESVVGDTLRIKGRYDQPISGNRLVLTAPGGTAIDSVILDAGEQTVFDLSVDLKVVGKFQYALVEKDSTGKQISNEPLPLNVTEKKSLQILIINSFPIFETKYLKNYLAEMGHSVTVRNRLTKGKYKFEYFNTAVNPIYGLSEKALEAYDLMIMDAPTYTNLSPNSLAALQNSTKNEGLGIFVQPEASFFNLAAENSGFEFIRGNGTTTTLNDWPKTSIDRFPYSFKEDFGFEEIHESQGNVLTAYRRYGKGRIGTTVLQSTYRWWLDGHTKAYQQLWSEIISALAKRNMPAAEWQPTTTFAYQDQPYEFTVRTSAENPEISNGDSIQIAILQNVDIPNLYNGTTYPRKTGWNRLKDKNDSTSVFNFYVLDTTQWKSVSSMNTVNANKRNFTETSARGIDRKLLTPIHLFWFFFPFLLGMGYLWLEPKLFS